MSKTQLWSYSGQNVSAINLSRHNGQIKDVRNEHLASDSIAMSGWTFSQIQNNIFFKLYLFKQAHKKLLRIRYILLYQNKHFKNGVSIIDFNNLVLSATY